MSAGIGKVFPVLAVAGIAAVGWFVFRPDSTGGKPTAANVLREGMSALSSLRSVYVRANARIPSTGDFNAVGGEYELQPIEMWKEFGESSKWRVENAGRVAVMDGQASLLLIQPAPQARNGVVEEGGAQTDFAGSFQSLVDLDYVLDTEGRLARSGRCTLSLDQEWGAGGSRKWVVTSRCAAMPQAASGADRNPESSDWLIAQAVTDVANRRVYRFDARTHLLENVKVFVGAGPGETLVIEAVDIVYDPAIAPETFALTLPRNVNWTRKHSPSRAGKGVALSPRDAAQAFFDACGREKWDEALEFWPESSFDDRFKSAMGGVRIVSLGEAARTGLYVGWFVPYEIRFKAGETSKGKLSMVQDKSTGRWVVDGGL